MDTIIFATKNKHKLKEINQIMSDMGVRIISMEDAGIDIDVVEDGTTFEENALKKATEIMQISGEIVLADDSGLEIDCLDKAPGVYSARYLGKDTPYEYKNKLILEKIKDVPKEKRSARFVCAVAVAFPKGQAFAVRGTIEGEIGYEAKGNNGFGYDPILYVPEYNKTMAEMSPEQKNTISHRGKALEQMKQKLKQRLEIK